MHDRASRGPGRAVGAARQSTTKDLVVGRACLRDSAMDDYRMRLPTASQVTVLYMRWRMGPASWLEWPWPGGHGPFLDTPKSDQLAEDRFRHPQIGQFAEDRFRHPQIGQFAEDHSSTYPNFAR